MDQSSTPARADDGVQSQPSSVLFREIHKNAWLKKLPNSEKRTGAFPKRGDRVWVVFCIHDDAEAFLETYFDQKLAVTHKPDWFVSLNNCLHVSPTICAHEDEFEFVITLRSDLIRLTAPSWDIMMEWVDTIGSKLREMKILSPRENIYSKMPEARLPLAPTRDPNSPLPLPPAGPSSLLPGVERVQLSENSSSSASLSSVSSVEASSSSDSSDDSAQPLERQEYDDVCVEIGSSTTSLYITQSEPHLYRRHQSLSRATSVPDSPLVFSSSLMSTPSTGGSEHTGNNVTVIEVSSRQHHPSPAPLDMPQRVFNFNFVPSSTPDTIVENIVISDQERNDEYFTPPITPAALDRQLLNVQADPAISSVPRVTIVQLANVNQNVTTTPSPEASELGNSHYECVFLPPSENVISVLGPSVGSQTSEVASSQVPSVEHPRSGDVAATERIVQYSDARGPRLRRRSSSTSEGVSSPRGFTTPERHRGGPESERRLQPAPHPYRQHQLGNHGGGVEVIVTGRLTLREQQVLQLSREMQHPGGVRLQLRRKDCTGSMALVDAFGGVWIAGWKQREHPMLYNALHIGDQLLSTAGVLVHSASDAQKLVRGATSLYVEFVIRRVPFGRVFAIRRDTEGQVLGIVQEGNTAEIRDVLPGSLAARHGLSSRAQTCDGLSLTTWVLTEINGRPLNLFFKDGEVKDRLNAIGREISILVQPFDLIKQLKKQLKSLRSYKDYIVQ